MHLRTDGGTLVGPHGLLWTCYMGSHGSLMGSNRCYRTPRRLPWVACGSPTDTRELPWVVFVG